MTEPASLAVFREHGPWSDPGRHGFGIEPLESNLQALVQTVRGLLVHSDYLDLYGLSQQNFPSVSRQTLPVEARLAEVLSADPAPLSSPRPLEKRLPATCRDYALMLCAFLREKSNAARVRCGFATYFLEGKYEDHWVCEYWNADKQEWCVADAQLDDAHRAKLSIEFDSLDLPDGLFLTADQAWRAFRSGAVDASRFGHGAASGPWFLFVNLARDTLALRKQEVSNWDNWRAAADNNPRLDAEFLRMGDLIADAYERQHIERNFARNGRQRELEKALIPAWW